ncbi:hypothetical protein V6N12_007302 [Hibiscus sabdariffa]|uniref:RNase H type-1 domain-containing protein n=1 Tax=Hibiscus sabdariffa TaxID=183260 RepID=A0ABR2F1D6_9ROSI
MPIPDWNLWLFRNRKIFDLDNVESDTIIGCSRRLQAATCRALDIRNQQQLIVRGVRPYVTAWSTPSVGCLKIDVDGARRVVDGVASCGGVIRDSNGTWIAGFSKFIGRCSILEAEFWAIFEGLRCAKRFNVSEVVVESDNRDVIDVLFDIRQRSLYSSLLGTIKAIADDNWCVVYRHACRESNRVADVITRLFPLNSFEPHIFLYPPDEVLVFFT